MKRTVSELVKLIGQENCTVIGRTDRHFQHPAPISNAAEGDLSFCTKKGEEARALLKITKASVILCHLSATAHFKNKTLITVENPRLCFIHILKAFFPVKKPTGIHSSAVIGKGCTIGLNVYLGPNVVVGDKVMIGEDSIIYSGVYIYDGVKIGKNVTVKPNSVIGSSGAGYERNENGVLERFPQIGNVTIEDNVDVGANCCVDRGALSNTVIKEGAKLDNLINVAHNDVIGKNCFVAAGAIFSGSVSIGDGCFIGVSASFKEGVKVGNNVTVGMGAVVIRDVSDGDVVAGVPAKSLKKTR
jgi:UDP-3-O-[3-hydroxymyristoyl] glucosamine N-acyltransferase